jgi:RNA polymerase sigma-54 factor
MIQAMQILQLPLLDLEARIEQELTENPFLEREENKDGEAGSAESNGAQADAPQTGAEKELEQLRENFERLEREYGDGRPEPRRVADDGERRFDAIQNVAGEPASLHQVLIEQVGLLETSERRRKILEYIVWSLDHHGYLTGTRMELIEEINSQLSRPLDTSQGQAPNQNDHEEHGDEGAQENKDEQDNNQAAMLDPSEDEFLISLAQLRRATHPALAAEDLRECLLLQLDAHGEWEGLLRQIIDEHLPDVEANRLPRIAKATGVSIEEVKLALEDLRHMDPAPGAVYGGTTADVIVPEVVVLEENGEWVVRLDRERQPRLTLSRAYEQTLKKLPKGDPAREWIRKRRENAQWFLDALRQRKSTLRLIAETVFKHQRAFLEKGVESLVPLRMQDVADIIKVHISTVSRGVSGKFAETPHGIFPIKFFFAGGTTRDTGEETSQKAIQERLRALIRNEDAQKPYSDEQLAGLLSEKEGLTLARRTVTKYRKALDIPSSTQRRQY